MTTLHPDRALAPHLEEARSLERWGRRAHRELDFLGTHLVGRLRTVEEHVMTAGDECRRQRRQASDIPAVKLGAGHRPGLRVVNNHRRRFDRLRGILRARHRGGCKGKNRQ